MAPHTRRAPLLLTIAITLVGLSGCITAQTSPNEDLPAAPVDGNGIITAPYGDIHVTLSIPDKTQPGHNSTWHMTVRHDGDPGAEAFPYSDVCHSPWQIALYDASGALVPRSEPLAECEAYGTADLEPGDRIDHDWSWNVRHWDPNAERYEPLPAGDYELVFRFERQDPDDGRGGGPSATHLFTVA